MWGGLDQAWSATVVSRVVRVVCLSLAASSWVLGCGDDSTGASPPDGGALDAALDGTLSPDGPAPDATPRVDVAPPTAPAPPALPVITPCPDGWREIPSGVGDAVVCEPWPASGRIDDCPDGSAHFPGESACAPLGRVCPTEDEWPADLPADARILYVRPGETSGDGSRARPFGDIRRAISMASSDAIIALARGTHVVASSLHVGSRTLQGACAAETVLVAEGFGPLQAPIVLEDDGTVRDLTVRSSGTGIVAIGGASIVDGVVVDSAGFVGVHVDGEAATLTLRSSIVKDTRVVPDAPSPDSTAVFAENGAHVIVERTRLEGCVGACVFAFPSTIELDSVSISRVTLVDAFDAAHGIVAQQGGVVRATRTVIEADRPPLDRGGGDVYAGVVANMGSEVTLESSVLRGAAFGVVPLLGSHVSLTRTWVDGYDEEAIATTRGSTVDLADVVVRGGGPDHDLPVGAGFELTSGVHLTASRVAMGDVVAFGIIASDDLGGEPATATIEDVSLFDVRAPLAITYMAFGIAAVRRAHVTVRRARLERPGLIGVSAESTGTVDAEDVHVTDTRASMPGAPDDPGTAHGGYGINVVAGLMTVRRALVERAETAGVVMYGGSSTLDAADLDVRDVAPQSSTGRSGIGVVVIDGVEAEGALRASFVRTRIVGTHEVGLLVQGAVDGRDVDVEVTATDLETIDTAAAACLPECETPASGTALSVSFGSSLSVEGFRVVRAAYAGVLFDAASTLRLVRGEIAMSRVGLLYTGSDALDPARVLDDVTFTDNIEDVVTRQVAVPRAPGVVIEP